MIFYCFQTQFYNIKILHPFEWPNRENLIITELWLLLQFCFCDCTSTICVEIKQNYNLYLYDDLSFVFLTEFHLIFCVWRNIYNKYSFQNKRARRLTQDTYFNITFQYANEMNTNIWFKLLSFPKRTNNKETELNIILKKQRIG